MQELRELDKKSRVKTGTRSVNAFDGSGWNPGLLFPLPLIQKLELEKLKDFQHFVFFGYVQTGRTHCT